jgi:hypothetical protein
MTRKNGGDNEPVFEHNHRPAAKQEQREPRRFSTAAVSYDGVSNQLLRDTIVAVTDAGAAILLSRTADRGAFSVQVYDGNERIREWPHTVEELESVLGWLRDMFASD